MSNTIDIVIAGLTDPGLVRANNEDAFFIADPETGQRHISNTKITEPVESNRLLMIVSDGMGGYEGGEIASRLAVKTIKSEIPRLSKKLSPQSRLEAAIEEANTLVWAKKREDPSRRSMGATITVALIEKNVAYIAEVGDSRAYVVRGNRIKQITTDQTVLQVLIDSGALTPELAEQSYYKNTLLQALGAQEYLQIAVTSLQLNIGDILLLCSDGLHNKLSADEMKAMLKHYRQPGEAVEALIEEAKRRGGEDNITAVVAHFGGDGLKRNSIKMRTITETLNVISRFDPEQEAKKPAPKLETRPATFGDLLNTAVFDHFAQSDAQLQELSQLTEFGEFICFRKGDRAIIQGDNASDGVYLLLSGCYRIEYEQNGQRDTIALIVSPTDTRSEEDIQGSLDFLRVKRQFFIGGMEMLRDVPRSTTTFCEDEKNCVIRMPHPVYFRISQILGDRFILAIRHS